MLDLVRIRDSRRSSDVTGESGAEEEVSVLGRTLPSVDSVMDDSRRLSEALMRRDMDEGARFRDMVRNSASDRQLDAQRTNSGDVL